MWKRALVLSGLLATLTSSLKVNLSWENLVKEEFFLKIQNSIALHDVTELNLQGNKFDSFLDCSTRLDNLEILDLSQNRLQRFFFLCNEEYNLMMLNVSHNNLQYLNDGALNHRTRKMKILDISYNMLKVFNGSMLQHMQRLEFLSLAHNPINDQMEDDAFYNLYSLKFLDLSNISASRFSDILFRPLHALVNLSLSSNPIFKIPKLPETLEFLDISETNVIGPVDFSLPALRVLMMNAIADLTSMDLSDFSNFTSLEELSVENCPKLRSLRVSRPGEDLLPGLQRLSVKNCSLQNVNVDLQSAMRSMTFLDLQENPWNCDCNLRWVRSLNLTKGMNRELRCERPEAYRHIRLFDIPPSDLNCNVNLSIWISIAILTSVVVAAFGYFIFKRVLLERLPCKKQGVSVTYSNVNESSNDLDKILGVTEAHNSYE